MKRTLAVALVASCSCWPAGCASVRARPPAPVDAGEWNAVAQLPRGEHVIVTIDCDHAGLDVCNLAVRAAATDRYPFIDAALVEVADDALLLRPRRRDTTVLLLPRPAVVAVDAEVDDARVNGTLVGVLAGLGVCAVAGCFTESDIVFYGKVMIASWFAAGGAGVGYLIDRGRRTTRRIYRRSGGPPQTPFSGVPGCCPACHWTGADRGG